MVNGHNDALFPGGPLRSGSPRADDATREGGAAGDGASHRPSGGGGRPAPPPGRRPLPPCPPPPGPAPAPRRPSAGPRVPPAAFSLGRVGPAGSPPPATGTADDGGPGGASSLQG